MKIQQGLVSSQKYFESEGHNHKYNGILLSQSGLLKIKTPISIQLNIFPTNENNKEWYISMSL